LHIPAGHLGRVLLGRLRRVVDGRFGRLFSLHLHRGGGIDESAPRLSSLVATLVFATEGLVDWRLGLILSVASYADLLGAVLAKRVSNLWLFHRLKKIVDFLFPRRRSRTGHRLETLKLKAGFKASSMSWFCSGQMDLKTTQQAIATDWIGAYKFYVRPNPPISRVASPVAAATPLNSDQVWVNTKSGKYWKPGSRYHGKTKKGTICPKRKRFRMCICQRTARENHCGPSMIDRFGRSISGLF
jgi:hypothetical protein